MPRSDRTRKSSTNRLEYCLLCVGLLAWYASPSPHLIAAELPRAVLPQRISGSQRTGFLRADALLDDGQLRAAVAAVLEVMDEAGERLIRVPNDPVAERLGFENYLPVRDRVHLWLAELAAREPAALAEYRSQADPAAERIFASAARDADARAYQRIVDEYFTSQLGDDALLQLGALARQRGEYTLARRYWQPLASSLRHIGGSQDAGRDAYPWQLIPPGAPAPLSDTAPRFSSSWLSYPDTDFDVAELRAWLTVLSILEGDRDRAARELEWLRRHAPQATGVVAGRRGQLADLLASLLKESSSWIPRRSPEEWPTFGGSSRRWKIADNGFDLAGRSIWQRTLPRLRLAEVPDEGVRVAEPQDGLLSFHPIAQDGIAYYAAGLHTEDIEAVELATGQVVFPRRSLTREQEIPRLPGAISAPRMTLTASGQTLLALTLNRRGLPARIAALDLLAERKLLYDVQLDDPEWPGTWIFEGVPVADGEAFYGAVRRIDQVRHACEVACFDLRDGRLRWRQPICEAESERSIASGYLSNLLTLHEGTLYYNTNLGAVAALRAADGRLHWLLSYPRNSGAVERTAEIALHQYRDLTPCLIAQDIVVVAARDSACLFAIDAISGALLWTTPAGLYADAIHLLGVADEHLILSGDRLVWLDLHSGRARGQFPSPVVGADGQAKPSPRGVGRGLLAGAAVYWPTRDAIYVFEQQTIKTDWGWQPQLRRRIELAQRGAGGGNLLLHRGILLIATADKLYAFTESGFPQYVNNRPTGRPEAR